MKLHYSIFKYAPITSTLPPITLGIIFHVPSLNFREFRYAHDLSRLSQLYPDLDIEIIEKLLYGIKEEVEMRDPKSKQFDIEDYTRFYLNDFRFGDVEKFECEDLDETIARLVAIYL